VGKRGPKPKELAPRKWTSDLAYIIGLIATDGCLSGGRNVILVSKDKEILSNFQRVLKTKLTIGRTTSGLTGATTPRIQFSNVLFYKFLVSIGLTPAKSKTIGSLKIPKKYFFDFLRGVFDGDGSTYSYWDKRWRSSFMFYVQFASASPVFIEWLRFSIERNLHIRGHITTARGHGVSQLKYAKREGLLVLRRMYAEPRSICLSRKHLKTTEMLAIVGEQL